MINKIAEIWAGGCEIKLILHIPNNRKICNIWEAPFFDRIVDFQGKKLTSDSINYFEGLREEIKLYCEYECFYTDDGDDALELEINVGGIGI